MACREDIKEGSEEQDLNYESQRLMKTCDLPALVFNKAHGLEIA